MPAIWLTTDNWEEVKEEMKINRVGNYRAEEAERNLKPGTPFSSA